MTPEQAGIQQGGVWDGKTLSVFLSLKFGVTLHVRQCQRLFRQPGFRLRKPRLLIAHADAVAQAAFKKLQNLADNPGIDLWAIDEVHFQQHGSRCRMWVPPEVPDPVVLHHPTRKSVGYFGAVRLWDGKFIAKSESNKFNAQTNWSFFRYVRKTASRSGRSVVVISDNARYHHAQHNKKW